jgi:DNA-binding MurR/RpiR family transcriptional regulator
LNAKEDRSVNVLQSLTELYNSQDIDSVYRDLALKILGNLDQMRRVTIYDIADLTNSSRTTVWRLVQKLGYESFSDFRYALQSAASQYVYYNRMIEQRKTASGEALLKGLSRQLSDANALLTQLVTAEEIDELTDEIAASSKVHFYIPFRTSFIYSFQQNLWIDGKNSEYQCLLPQMLSATRYLDDRSITLISTIEHAETQDMTRVFEAVKETGSTIWLTGKAESRYADYADRLLLVSKAPAAVWLIAFELFILALSERYRSRFIDK